MSTITENLNTIKNSIDRMKIALNLPANTPLEDITTNVEQGGGGSVKSNIYKVSSIEERDAITDMVEGDMCVVQESTIANITATTEFQTAICPATVVLPTALIDYVDLRFNAVDTSKMFDCWGNLDSNYFMMDCYTDTGSIRIEYTSNDGITYTRTYPTEDNIDFGTPIVYSYPEMWNDVIGYFLQAGNVNFEGIFEYKDGVWKYANIGLSLTANEMFKPNKGYSNSGVVEGSLIRDEYRKFNIAISDEAPTKKEGLWIKLKDKESYEYSYGSYITFLDNNPELTNVINTLDVSDETMIKANSEDGHAVVGNEVYCFSINNTVSSAKLNFLTGEVTHIADAPNQYINHVVYVASENCIYLCNNSTATYLGLWRYSIASNTYTKLADPPGTGYDNPIHYDGARGRLLLCDGKKHIYEYIISTNNWTKVYTGPTSTKCSVSAAFSASNRCSKIEGDYFYGVNKESTSYCGIYKVNLLTFEYEELNTLLNVFYGEYLDIENSVVYGIVSKKLIKQHIDFTTGTMTTKEYPIGYYYNSSKYPIITVYNGELYLLLGTNTGITNKNIKKVSNLEEYKGYAINICIGKDGKDTEVCYATNTNVIGAIIPSNSTATNNKNAIDELYAAVNIGNNIYDWVLIKKYTE